MAEINIESFYIPTIVAVTLMIYFLSGIKIIRPNQRMAIETLGKFTRIQKSGITIVLPGLQRPLYLNIADKLLEVDSQEVITKDNLNCKVDAQVYYRVGETDEEVKNTLYVTQDPEDQIKNLSKTTLRNVIGDNIFRDVNSNRAKLNQEIFEIITVQTKNWGVRLIRVELKEVLPPEEVQTTMNEVIQAENAKQAAIDLANAAETTADGVKRAEVKKAEGVKQALILKADGDAQAIERVATARATEIQLVNESAEKYFVGNAQKLKELEVTQASLENNSKIVLTEKGITPTLVINETKDTIIPTAKFVDDEES